MNIMKQAEEKGTCTQGALLTHINGRLLDADMPLQHLSMWPPVKALHLCFRSPRRDHFAHAMGQGKVPSWLPLYRASAVYLKPGAAKTLSCKISTARLLMFLRILFAGMSAIASRCDPSALVGPQKGALGLQVASILLEGPADPYCPSAGTEFKFPRSEPDSHTSRSPCDDLQTG